LMDHVVADEAGGRRAKWLIRADGSTGLTGRTRFHKARGLSSPWRGRPGWGGGKAGVGGRRRSRFDAYVEEAGRERNASTAVLRKRCSPTSTIFSRRGPGPGCRGEAPRRKHGDVFFRGGDRNLFMLLAPSLRGRRGACADHRPFETVRPGARSRVGRPWTRPAGPSAGGATLPCPNPLRPCHVVVVDCAPFIPPYPSIGVHGDTHCKQSAAQVFPQGREETPVTRKKKMQVGSWVELGDQSLGPFWWGGGGRRLRWPASFAGSAQ